MRIYRLGKVSASRLILRCTVFSLGGKFSPGFLRTYSEEVRTITGIPKTSRRNPPVESSNSVPPDDPLEHLAGGYRRE